MARKSEQRITEADAISTMISKLRGTWLTFPQVKDGQTWGRSDYMKYDLVAVKKTWQPPTVHIYEVKVSRSDFLHDTKWPKAMEVSQQFSWVCPKDVIGRGEVDEKAGLVYVYPGGTARTVKAAVYRPTPLDPMLLLYLVLWRMEDGSQTREQRMAQIVKEMEARERTGKSYGFYIAKRLKEAEAKWEEAQRIIQSKESLARHDQEIVNKIADYLKGKTYWAPWQIARVMEAALLVDRAHGILPALQEASAALDTVMKGLLVVDGGQAEEENKDEAGDDRVA